MSISDSGLAPVDIKIPSQEEGPNAKIINSSISSTADRQTDTGNRNTPLAEVAEG